LNWLDIVLAVVFLLSVIGGFMKGFAKLVIGLLAAILGILLGIWFYGTAGAFLRPYVSHADVANFLGFMAIFLGVLLIGALIGKLLGMLFKWVGLSWLDRLLGAAFGLLRGLVFAIALILALMAFSPNPPPRSVVESRLAPYVIDAAHICAYMAPRQVRQAFAQSYDKVKQAWEEVLQKTRAGKRRNI
jgi:membrane protein required for colicin V production